MLAPHSIMHACPTLNHACVYALCLGLPRTIQGRCGPLASHTHTCASASPPTAPQIKQAPPTTVLAFSPPPLPHSPCSSLPLPPPPLTLRVAPAVKQPSHHHRPPIVHVDVERLLLGTFLLPLVESGIVRHLVTCIDHHPHCKIHNHPNHAQPPSSPPPTPPSHHAEVVGRLCLAAERRHQPPLHHLHLPLFPCLLPPLPLRLLLPFPLRLHLPLALRLLFLIRFSCLPPLPYNLLLRAPFLVRLFHLRAALRSSFRFRRGQLGGSGSSVRGGGRGGGSGGADDGQKGAGRDVEGWAEPEGARSTDTRGRRGAHMLRVLRRLKRHML
ncbi:unnamed protein product [Closterium sp. NIES-54]